MPLIHERTLFVMSTLYLMYLRVSELASNARWQPKMGHFIKTAVKVGGLKRLAKAIKKGILRLAIPCSKH